MITSFFNSGKGAGSGILYLIEEREPKAEVLRGDIHQQIQLIDSLDFKQRYLSGVHRFIETDIPDDAKKEIMDSFENMMFAGLSDEQKPPVLWVQHQEKGGTEFHFIIPEVEMESGKKFTPFWHKTDLKMVDAWKNTVNHEYGFADPNEPDRAQILTIPKNLPRSHKKAVEKINESITSMVSNGVLKNRDDVIKALEKSGFEIAKKSKNFISIKAEGWKKPARLKGLFYGEGFRSVGQLREGVQQASRDFEQGAEKRYQGARDRLQRELGKRTERNEKKYGANRIGNQQGKTKNNELGDVLELALVDARNSNSTVSGSDGNNKLHGRRGDYNERKTISTGSTRRENRPNSLRDKEGFETLRESRGLSKVQGWLQAIKVKAGELNDRTRKALVEWAGRTNERIRETVHQLERAGAIHASTNERAGRQNRDLDDTIRQNKHAHSTLAVAVEKVQEQKRSRSQGWSR